MTIKINRIKSNLEKYLKEHNLEKKWNKISVLLEKDLSHPSLHFKKIMLKSACFYSFRLDKKYRGVCILSNNIIEIILFTNHYE